MRSFNRIYILLITLLLFSGCGEIEEKSTFLEIEIEKEDENLSEGRYLFNFNCSTCHGSDAKGKIGPNIQGVDTLFINYAFSTVTLMQFLNESIDEREKQLISRYLKYLKEESL